MIAKVALTIAVLGIVALAAALVSFLAADRWRPAPAEVYVTGFGLLLCFTGLTVGAIALIWGL